jgi:L-threonylcarbamoyladenylate synthase
VKKKEILRLSTEEKNKRIIRQAAEVIKKGGLLSFPTETVYALGADATNEKAVEKVFGLKKREMDKPMAVFLSGPEELNRFVRAVSSPATKLMESFWPGPLTLIFKAKTGMLDYLTGREGKLGVRVSSSGLVQMLLSKTKTPLTATSANLSGKKEPVSAGEVLRYFGGKIDLILDGGPAKKGLPSSVVDVSGDVPILIREGRISFDELKRVVPELAIKK